MANGNKLEKRETTEVKGKQLTTKMKVILLSTKLESNCKNLIFMV